MKTIFTVLLMLIVSTFVFAQMSVQEINNVNWNWKNAKCDSVDLSTSADSVIVLGQRTYNILMYSVGGETAFKFSVLKSNWPHYFHVPSGGTISISGGKVDTVFAHTTDTATLYILWTKVNP